MIKGKKHSLDTRKKMSESAKKGEKHHNWGKPLSKEIINKIRKSLKGKNTWSKGRKVSEETRKKMSEAKRGNNWKGGYENHMWHVKRRRVLKLGNGGNHTLSEWETLKAQYNWTCPSCKKSEPEIKLSEDHIVPLSKGGSDNIENIQPLCQSCNSKKYNKIIKY